MNQVLLKKAIKLDIERKRRQWWHRIVQAMVAIVVFCTTYALILPAITMDEEYAQDMPGFDLDQEIAASEEYDDGAEYGR